MTFEQWWEKTYSFDGLPAPDGERKGIARMSWEAAVNYTMAELPQGHDAFCAFCYERCDGFAGNPGRWPLGFTHPDGTGIVKWHHVECVQEKVFRQ